MLQGSFYSRKRPVTRLATRLESRNDSYDPENVISPPKQPCRDKDILQSTPAASAASTSQGGKARQRIVFRTNSALDQILNSSSEEENNSYVVDPNDDTYQELELDPDSEDAGTDTEPENESICSYPVTSTPSQSGLDSHTSANETVSSISTLSGRSMSIYLCHYLIH